MRNLSLKHWSRAAFIIPSLLNIIFLLLFTLLIFIFIIWEPTRLDFNNWFSLLSMNILIVPNKLLVLSIIDLWIIWRSENIIQILLIILWSHQTIASKSSSTCLRRANISRLNWWWECYLIAWEFIIYVTVRKALWIIASWANSFFKWKWKLILNDFWTTQRRHSSLFR